MIKKCIMAKKNKRLILQRIRMRAAKHAKRRHTPKGFNSSQRKALRRRNIIVDKPRVPRKFRRNINIKNYSARNYKYRGTKRENIRRFLPSNLKYITEHNNSPFNLAKIRSLTNNTNNGYILIPENFSILTNPKQSIATFQKMLYALLIEDNSSVTFDYVNCKNVDLSTQALFDIILKEYDRFVKYKVNTGLLFPKYYRGVNMNDTSVAKMMWSVGSPANLGIGQENFPDVEKFKLRIYDNTKGNDEVKRMANKELDTTEIADYVVNSLKKMGKKLTSKKLEDLCNVIGEVLINAEEHSTTKHRFSCGYFKEETIDDKHFGLFKLVILNFGDTIYEKFKSGDCPNKEIVQRMNDLSKKYTRRLLFFPGKFEEESLWTLYALQEGVTSISPDKYLKRGNGSIRFIESFFNIKGSQTDDNVSKMTIVSGHTKIIFDGKYQIMDGTSSDGTHHKMMTFNDSGNIENKPDDNYVMYTNEYFPGTMICAELLLNDDDIKKI